MNLEQILSNEIKRIEKEVDRDVEKLVNNLARTILKEVVEKSPKDTGFLKANWQVTVTQKNKDTVPIGTTPTIDIEVRAGDTVKFFNNVSYAYIINGQMRFVEKVELMFPELLGEEIRKLKSEYI
jgi:uncharacterized protein CbrC (UPF0167 family)